MKTNAFIFSTVLYALLLSTVSLFGQHHGLGFVMNNTPYQDQSENYNGLFPLLGKKMHAKGHQFDAPYGVGIHALYYTQSFTVSDLIIKDSTSRVSITPDTMIQDTKAGEYQVTIRPNVWILPFLNVYGIAGYTEGEISPELHIPSFTLHIEDVGSLPIDTTFELKDKLKYHGPTFGLGATFATRIGRYFILADYHYSETNPDDLEGKLYYNSFSMKAGIRFRPKKNNHRFAMWAGSQYLSNKQTFRGTVNIEEISPEVAQFVGREASYSGDISPVNPWNFVIGGSWVSGRHHLTAEGGLFDRKQLTLGYQFRF